MKTLILLSSLLFSAHAFSTETVSTKEITISEEKATDTFSYYFGSIRVNQRSFVNYRITNTGSTPLDYQWERMQGDASYRATTNCFGTLYPGQRCSFTIEYAPYFQGPSSGLFEMQFAQGYGVRVYVSGNAVRW